MTQVVQAKCPQCQNVLRIPQEWLARPMRCKHCKSTFQAKGASSTAVSATVPIGKPANAAAIAQPTGVQAGLPIAAPLHASDDPFSFAEDDSGSDPSSITRPSVRRKKGNGSLLFVLMFFFLFLLGAGGAAAALFVVFTPDAWERFVHRDDPTDNPGPTTNLPVDDGGTKKPTPNGKSGKSDNGNKKPATFNNDPFPRRALLISINNYLMWNTVHYGSPQDGGRYPGSSTAVLRDRLTRPPMYFPVSQVYELSDGVPAEYKTSKPHSTQKSVLETTITDFVATCREQDRVMIFFAGHGASIDDVSYLVPIDGRKSKIESLLPLKWVYDQLAKCKAQQKILVLDVFRFSPSRGLELPSPGEGEEGRMPEGFDKDLQNPPAGVQVWSSCVKEQSAVELDEGSAFMQAICNAMQGGGKMKGIATAPEPIAIDDLVADVNQRLKTLLTGEKRTQVSRLTGKPGTSAVAYDASQPLASAITLKPPTLPGGDAAGAASIERILEELRIMPAVRDTRAGDMNLLKATNLPAFAAKRIDGYKGDGYQNITDLQNKYKNGKEAFSKEYPLRAAYFDTLDALQESKKVQMREVLSSPIDPKRKAAFLQEQAPLGLSIFSLEQILRDLDDAGKQREMETSKRWQANFDYIHARLQARLVYLYEYNYTLGQIRADNLPELATGQSGWRIGISGPKINVTEIKAKKFAKDTARLWKHIQEEYPETPWALLAERESLIALGLAWRPKSD